MILFKIFYLNINLRMYILYIKYKLLKCVKKKIITLIYMKIKSSALLRLDLGKSLKMFSN